MTNSASTKDTLGSSFKPKQENISYGSEARQKFIHAVNILADAVKCTLGPKGRNVMIRQEYTNNTIITKDGVSVAKAIEVEDKLMQMGVEIIRQVASQTNNNAGDGTTTATVIAQELVNSGSKAVDSGVNPIDIKRGMETALSIILEQLEATAVDCVDYESIKQVGTISANGDESIGKILADAIQEVGYDGVINIQKGNSYENTLEIVEGMQFDKGFLAPSFATDLTKNNVEFANARVLITSEKITNVKDIMPILEDYSRENLPLIIMAEDFEKDVIQTILLNYLQGKLKVIPIKNPGYDRLKPQLLDDIATMVGGKVVGANHGVSIKEIITKDNQGNLKRTENIKCIGKAERIIIDSKYTTIVKGNSDPEALKERIETIKDQMENTEDQWEINTHRQRLGMLTNGVAEISVGGSTDVEAKERYDRIEDALNATRSAVEQGIIAGGGSVLAKIAQQISDNEEYKDSPLWHGMQIVSDGIAKPLKQICENAGLNDEAIESIVSEVAFSSMEHGYDANMAEVINMMESGIIDPVKVTKQAVLNAISVASLILSSEAIVDNLDKPMPPMMPSMPQNPMM